MEKMEKDRKTDELEQKIREAFGFDEEQLLQEFHMADMAIRDDELPKKSPEDFEKAVMRIEMETLRDKVMETEDAKGKTTRKKKRILKTAKVMVVAAALMIAMFGMTIVGVGGKHYYFTVKERDSIRNDIVVNNDEVLEVVTDEEEAYRQIEKILKMDALKIGERPDGMDFKKIQIDGSQAVLAFSLDNNLLYLYESKLESSHSYNIVFDGNEIGKCKNEWLNEEFTVLAQENDNSWEYAIQFTRKNMCFMLKASNLTLSEFLSIISDLHF